MTYAFKGLMVLYRLTEGDALATRKRREDARQNIEKMHDSAPGFQAHVGNKVGGGDRISMIVTRVNQDEFGPGNFGINGQAFLDGNDSLWVVSVQEGDQPGQWEAITNG